MFEEVTFTFPKPKVSRYMEIAVIPERFFGPIITSTTGLTALSVKKSISIYDTGMESFIKKLTFSPRTGFPSECPPLSTNFKESFDSTKSKICANLTSSYSRKKGFL